MAFFKIHKNKTASAASTPAQTPRSSMQTSSRFPVENKMTKEQAMELIYKNAYAGGPQILSPM